MSLFTLVDKDIAHKLSGPVWNFASAHGTGLVGSEPLLNTLKVENVQIAAGKSDYFSVSEQFVAKSAFVVLVKVKLVRFVFYSFFLELHNSTRYSMINFLGTFNEGFEGYVASH